MSVMKVVWAGIKKRKVYSMAIALLVLMMGVLLTVGISLTERSTEIYNDVYDKTESSHMQYYFSPSYTEQVESFERWFREDERIKAVTVMKLLMLNDISYDFAGKEKSEYVVDIYPDTAKLMNADRDITTPHLEWDEVALPLYYQTKYNLSIGDLFEVSIGNVRVPLRIESFFIDPIHGSDMITVKTAVVSEDRLNAMIDIYHEQAENIAHIEERVLIGVVLYEDNLEHIRGLNQDFYGENDVPINTSYSIELYRAGALYMVEMVLTSIIGFSILLFLIIILVIRNAILSAIETDYTNIGILKALGFTGNQIRMTVFLQFSILGIVGIIGSIVVSVIIMPYVGNVVLSSTGLIWYGTPSIVTMVLVMLTLLLVINSIVYIISRKVMGITPVEAITGGNSDVYFNSYGNIALKKLAILPLNLRMGLKQLLTRGGQYMMLCVISAVLIMVTGMVLMSANLFNDIDTAYQLFGLNKVSVEITGPDEAAVSDVLDDIVETYQVPYANLKTIQNILIDIESISAIIWDSPDQVKLQPLKGRFPIYENEISLTKNLSRYFDKKIGDTINVTDATGEKKLEYIVTGYHQYISNMGKTVFMSGSGLKRIDPDAQLTSGEVLFQDTVNLDQVMRALEDKYENGANGVDISRRDYTYSTVILVKKILTGIAVGMLVLVSVITSIITMLQALIVSQKETKELGIYKAIGYSPLQIRLQFAARFGAVTCMGGIVGCVLCRLFGARLLEIMLSALGITKFVVNISVVHEAISVGLLTMVALVVSFLVARRIKRVSPRLLISE